MANNNNEIMKNQCKSFFGRQGEKAEPTVLCIVGMFVSLSS